MFSENKQITTALKQLDEIFRKLLKSQKLDFLKSVYLYKKRKEYFNFNWMIGELSNWEIVLIKKDYKKLADVAIALINYPDFLNPLYIQYTLARLKDNIGDEDYFKNDKYGLARATYKSLENYFSIVNKMDLIAWVKNAHMPSFISITRDPKWHECIPVHLLSIHTAFQSSLRKALDYAKISYSDDETVQALYKKLTNQSISNTSETKLIASDGQFLHIFNEIRNKETIANVNPLIKIDDKQVALYYLMQIKFIVEKIEIFANNARK